MPERSVFTKVILYALAPVLFVLILAVILTFHICRYACKWFAYGITALKVFLAFFRWDYSSGNGEISDVIEFSGFLYDPEQDIFFSKMDAWQREFGYCRLYDEAASPFGMVVDSEPVYFEYEGKRWLIEFWKGQYDLTTGCEVGIYTSEDASPDVSGVFNGTFYYSGSNEELLRMSYSLRKNNKTLFIRNDKHWWLTGFKLGEFSEPSELTMKIYITLKDEYMCDAFVKGLKSAGYSDRDIKQYGVSVSFIFSKPKTRQPFTRTKYTDWIIQRKNRYMCMKYQKIAGKYNNLQDKLQTIQGKAPKLYRKMMNIGMTEKTYRKCLKMNSYFN